MGAPEETSAASPTMTAVISKRWLLEGVFGFCIIFCCRQYTSRQGIF